VACIDTSGNVTVDDNGGNYYLFQTWQLEVYFTDDIESGEGLWSANGLWHIVEETSGCNEHYSPVHSWYYGQEPECNFDIGANSGTLTSDIIDLTGTSQAEYRVWYWFDGESYETYDFLSIQIQIVGGTVDELMKVYTPTGGWQECVLDLGNYVGNDVQLHFTFDSVDGVANTYQGAYIDNVAIIAAEPCTQGTPTPGSCINHGDVNLNGEITAEDAQIAFQIALGVWTATPQEYCAADCNGNGEVTAADAQGVFAAALGAGECSDPL